jgi:formamidopyrimidine-DNA glycosylase
MPELPEVELVARALDQLTTGQRILVAELLRPGLAPETSPKKFGRLLQSVCIERVGRRGKHLLIEMDNGQALIVHLRMTGRFLYLPKGAPLPKFAHAVFHLDSDRRLVFCDQRHFGMMKIVARSRLFETKELRSLAPEPFSDSFTVDYLHAALGRSRRTLKETLLDQKRVTGLGNIYAAEVMFLARANPFIVASEFSRRRVPRLHRAILATFTDALAYGSTLNVDPENIDGSYGGGGGGYASRWRVYDREGEPCHACGARIRRVAHAGRSTYFCPRCQRR